MNNIKEMNQCFTGEWDNLLGDLALTCSMAIHFPHPSAFPAAAAGGAIYRRPAQLSGPH